MQRWIMNSVRLHLLVLALLPLVVLIPALLAVGMTRCSASFNALLIANVESDLRIAEQYLKRIISQGNAHIAAISGSVFFAMQKIAPQSYWPTSIKNADGLAWIFYTTYPRRRRKADLD